MERAYTHPDQISASSCKKHDDIEGMSEEMRTLNWSFSVNHAIAYECSSQHVGKWSYLVVRCQVGFTVSDNHGLIE